MQNDYESHTGGFPAGATLKGAMVKLANDPPSVPGTK
jgi:hypothetical protein